MSIKHHWPYSTGPLKEFTDQRLDKSLSPAKRSSLEFFFLQYRDDLDSFRFEDPVIIRDLEGAKRFYQLETLNSFYLKKRSNQTLHTLYALAIDIDGIRGSLPLSHIDILRRWGELGFPDPPTEIRITCQGRFHIIIRIEPARAFPEKISYWKKCSKGLYKAFKDLGADEVATTNIVGFVRIPGHKNCKYPGEQIVETVSQSESIFTLTEIHRVLLENALVQESITYKKSTIEKIEILEKGVPPGIGNNVCLTLAIFYREQGLSEEETRERLYSWNASLQAPDPAYNVKNTVRSAYKNGYSLSLKYLNKWVEITIGENKSNIKQIIRKPITERNKIVTYANQIQDYLESEHCMITISQRTLAKELNIPFRSFSHALKLIPGLTIQSIGKGRNSKTKFILKKEIGHLKLIYSNPKIMQ